MLEDMLGRASWPLAAIIAAFIAGVTIYNVNQDVQENRLRQTCIEQRGTVHERTGGPPSCELAE